MNMFRQSLPRGLVLAIAIVLATGHSPPAAAVVKNVQIVNSAGQPLPRQTVKITLTSGRTFPDGAKEKRAQTDDDGMLIFDFPDGAEYLLTYPGGTMTVSTAAGFPWVPVIGAAAAITAVAVASDSDDNDDSGGGGGNGPLNGDCTLGGVVTTNPDGHPDNFTGATCSWSTTTSNATVQCTNGANLNVTLNGPLDTGAETFSLTGTGSYQGFTGTGFTFAGGYNPVSGVVAGTTAAGTNGNLPDSNMNSVNEPINYSFDCTVPVP